MASILNLQVKKGAWNAVGITAYGSGDVFEKVNIGVMDGDNITMSVDDFKKMYSLLTELMEHIERLENAHC